MVRTCKYVERNQEERKCSDYYISHSKGSVAMCRLTEWKKKQGTCPYDSSIRSKPRIAKGSFDETQKTLGGV